MSASGKIINEPLSQKISNIRIIFHLSLMKDLFDVSGWSEKERDEDSK